MLNFGSEQTIEAAGKSYRLSRLKVKHIRAFRDWVAARVGDPFSLAERMADKLPAEQVMTLVREAEEVQRQLDAFTLTCPLGLRYLGTEAGHTEVVRLLLDEHHPQATDDEVEAVAEVVALRVIEILTAAQGDAGPNAEAPAAASRGASTGTRSTEDSCEARPA